MTYRRILVTALAAAAVGLAGCGGQATSGSGGPPSGQDTTSAKASPSVASSPSTAGAVQADLSATGLGPYTVGAKLTDLRDRGLALDVEETPACPGIAVAKGTAAYQSPALVFFNGELQYLTVNSPLVRTTAAAAVDMPIAVVQAKYPDASTLNDGQSGMALLAKDSSGKYALLFRIRVAGTVESIDAGLAETLEFRFSEGEGC